MVPPVDRFDAKIYVSWALPDLNRRGANNVTREWRGLGLPFRPTPHVPPCP